MEGEINILIVVKHDGERKRILSTLMGQDNFVIVSIENDGVGAIIKSEALKPDIAIVDLQSIEIPAIDLVRMIRRRSPSTKVIILSDSEDEYNACLAIKAGLAGYLYKEKDFDKLELIIRIVYMGGYYISNTIIPKVFGMFSVNYQFPGQFKNVDHGIFTPSERSVVAALANGYTDEEISDNLHLSVGSIRNCIISIKRKTKLKNRVGIVLFSLVYGIIGFENLELWKKKGELIFKEYMKNNNRQK